MKSSRVSVVVPAKDEAATLAAVLDRVAPFADELWVIDGHSTDQTSAIAHEMGARVLLDHGRGKGDAVRLAAQHVTGDVVLFIDADGSHDPADIPRLLAPIASDEADLVIGSRMRGGSDELHSDPAEAVRLIGSTLITQAINIRFGVRLTDYQNGFRAIRSRVLKTLGLKEDTTTIEQEMAIRALAMGFRVTEVATHEYVRRGGTSKISVFRVAHRYLYQLLRDLSWPPKTP